MTQRLQLTRVMPASRAEVYQAWVDATLLSQWFAPGPMTAVVSQLDATEGGRFRIEMRGPDRVNVAVGTFLELTPGERLVFSWAWEGWALPETTVRVELRALDRGGNRARPHARRLPRRSRTGATLGRLGPDDYPADRHPRVPKGEVTA